MKSERDKLKSPACRVILKSSANPGLRKGRDGKPKLVVRNLTLRMVFDGEIKTKHHGN